MEKRRSYLDVLCVLACFMVLWDHVDGMFHTYAPGKTWLLSAIIHVAVNPAVPLFVMISGANLLDYRKKYSTGVFFRKRAISVLIPFLFWSVFYMFFWWTQDSSLPGSITDAINGVLYNNAYNGFFWFFYPLFGLYLAIPIFSALDEQWKKKVYLYGILGYLVLGGLIPVIFSLLGLKINGGFRMEVISEFIFYALFGYFIDHYELKKTAKILIYTVGTAAFIYNVLHLMIASTKIQSVAGDYTYYTYILTAMAVFTLFRNIPEKLIEKLASLFRPIRDVTFGVYLVQRFVLHFASKLVNTKSVWYLVFGVFPVFLVCIILCKVIKKIPVIKHTI